MSEHARTENDLPFDDVNRAADMDEANKKSPMESEKMKKHIDQNMEIPESRVLPDTTSASSSDTIQPDKTVRTQKPRDALMRNWWVALASGFITQEEYNDRIEMNFIRWERQQREAAEKIQPLPRADRIKMVVVGRMSEQCDDMIRQASNMFTQLGKPDVVITRLNVFMENDRYRKLRSMCHFEDEEEMNSDFDEEVLLMESEANCWEMVNMDRGADQSHEKFSDDMPIYARVKHTIETLIHFDDLKDLIDNRLTKPREWVLSGEWILEQMNHAIEATCGQTDILVCAPGDMVKFYNRFRDSCEWDVVLIEETARVSKVDQYVLRKCAPHAILHLTTGDIEQPGPSSAASGEDKCLDEVQQNPPIDPSAQISMVQLKRVAALAGLKVNNLSIDMTGVEPIYSAADYDRLMAAENDSKSRNKRMA